MAAMALAAWPLMGDMGVIPMPGGWSLSTVWLPICGQAWSGAWLHFMSMWAVMMVPMMLPALAPSLWRYHAALVRAGTMRCRTLAMCTTAAAGWAAVWLALGALLYPAGTVASTLLLEAPRMAALVTPVSVLAGALGLWWHLATRRARCQVLTHAGHPGFVVRTACRHGLALGVHCVRACAGLMVALLAAGLMDWRANAAASALVLAERLFAIPSIRERSRNI